MKLKIPILAALAILTTLIAVPLATPRVQAINGNGVFDAGNQWAPTGPDYSLRNIIFQQYGDDQSELNAFQTGQIDVMDTGQSGSGVPVSLYGAFQSNPDWLITPTQGAAIYHGIYFNLDDLSDGSGTVWHSWGCSFAHGNSPCGIEIRQAFAHLLDRPRFVSDGPLQGGGVALADDIPSNKGDPILHQVVASSLADQCSWDTFASKYAAVYGTCISAFNLAPDAGGFAAPGSPDFCAAVDHLIQATVDAPSLGLVRDSAAPLDAFGNHCGIDPASPGLPNIAAHKMRAMVRSTNPRLTMGLNMVATMAQLFGGTSVNTVLTGGGGKLGAFVFFCCTGGFATDDWEWYTFGYQDAGPYPSVFSQFHSSFASNLCGGPLVVQPPDVTFVCIAAADTPLLNSAQTLDTATLYTNVYAALNVLGSHTVDLPAYTLAVRGASLRSVAGLVNQIGLSYENAWVFNSAHKSSYSPVDSRFQFNAGGPSDTIRWGQAGGDIVANLSPYFAQWVWEFNILGEVYDTLFALNPVSPTQVLCWICNSFSTTNLGNGNERIDVQLKQNLHWQDGVALDASDVKFSILTERDYAAVLSGNVALVLDVNVLNPLTLSITMQGQSIQHPLNVGGTLLMPKHIFDSGDNFYGQGVGRPAAVTLDPGYDPVAQGTFIGSGPFECVSNTGKVGGGCTSSGGQALASGDTMRLTAYDNTASSASPFDQWFRYNNPNWGTGSGAASESGQYQEFSYADRYDNDAVTITDVAAVEACVGHTSSGCADGGYWLKPFLHGGSGTISSEAVVVLSHLDDSLLSPFSWSGGAQQPGTTLGNVAPFIGNCAPYNVDPLTAPCYP